MQLLTSLAAMRSMRTAQRSPRRITLAYLAFSVVWIVFSDLILTLANLPTEVEYWVSVCKGIFFVLLSAIFIYVLMRREMKRVAEATNVLTAVIDGTSDAIFVKDRRGKYLLFNSAAGKYVGLPPDQVVGADDHDLFDPESVAKIRQHDRRVVETGQPVTEEVILTARGITRTFLAVKSPFRDDEGKITGVIGISRDITERKQSEDRLRKSEERFRTLGDQLLNGAVFRYQRLANGENRFLHYSKGGEKIFGVPLAVAQQSAASLMQLVAEEDRGRVLEAERVSMDNLSILDEEFRAHDRSGELRWFQIRSAPTRQPDGSTIWEGLLLDITDRRRAEERIRQLSAAIEQSPNSVVITNPQGSIEYVNPAFTETTGYQRDEAIGQNPRMLKSGQMPPEFYREMWATLATGKIWRGEVLNRRKDGTFYWELASISPLRDAQGRTTHYIAVKEEITERKRAEQKLQESEARLRAVLNNLHASVAILDPHGTVVWVNDAPLEAAGLTREQVLGKTFSEAGWWKPGSVEESVIRDAVVRAAKGERLRFDIASSARGGLPRIIDFQIDAIRDSQGNVEYLVPTAINITERKKAEKELRRRKNLYAMLAQTNRAVSQSRSTDELFHKLCLVAVDEGEFCFAWVGEIRDDKIVPVAKAGSKGDEFADQLHSPIDPADPRGNGPTSQAALTGEPVVVNYFQHDSPTAAGRGPFPSTAFRSAAAFPLNERGLPVAVFTVYSSSGGFFTEELLATLQEITPSVSFALDSFVSERERRQAEICLQESEKRFRSFMDYSPAVGWITDLHGRLEYHSSGFTKLFGLPEGSYVGRPLDEVLPEKASAMHEQYVQALADGERFSTTTFSGSGIGGKRFDIVLYRFALPRPSGGKAIGAIAVDVTDLRQAEDRLRVLGTAIDSSPNAVFIADRNGTIHWANPAFTQMSGYSLEEILGQNPRLLRSGRHDDEFYHKLWDTVAKGRVWTGEVIERHKSGREYTVRQTITPLTGPDGQVAQYVAVQEDITESKQAEARLRDMVVTDALTGLLNRSGFREQLVHHLARSCGAIHFLDLDRFKLVNDALGHHVGDVLLRQVAERIRQRVRTSDIPARLGGDEFAVIQAGVKDAESAAVLARGLIESLKRPFVVQGEEVQIGVSIGITRFPDDGVDADALIKNADLAMYRAKNDGRGDFRFFNAELEAEVLARVTLENEIRRALERNEFEAFYQPQVTVAGETLTGVEALIRWRHPLRGLVPPGAFLSVAEDSGLILPMSDWMLRTACQQGRVWLDGGRPLRVAVNVSVAQVRRGDLIHAVKEALKSTNLPPELLELEITESLLLPDLPDTEGLITALHDLGVTLAIDDFGTGFSSLSYLRQLPVDRLKIDRSFVTGLPGQPREQSLVRAITGLGHDLGMQVIAEGVENPDQLAFLRECECDEAQGYLFGRPVPSHELQLRS